MRLHSAFARAAVLSAALLSSTSAFAQSSVTLVSWENVVPDAGIFEVVQSATYSDGSIFNCDSTWIDTGNGPRDWVVSRTGPLSENSIRGRWSRVTPPSSNPSSSSCMLSSGATNPNPGAGGNAVPVSSNGQYVERDGDTMTGPLGMGGNKIVDVAAGEVSATSTEVVNGSQLFETNQAVAAADTAANNALVLSGGALQRTGGTMTGDIALGGNGVTGLRDGDVSVSSTDAVTGRQLSATNDRVVTAEGRASNAEITADSAIGIAVTARDQATIASGVASNAQTVANNASTTAANAQTVANNASNTATDAQTVAGSAQAAAVAADTRSAAALAASDLNAEGLRGVATSLGAGAAYDANSGTFSQPNFQVAGGTYNNVASALGALDDAITASGGNAVVYTDNTRTRVVLGGSESGPVAVANVAAGALDASSTDAVNGAQLDATNRQVASLDGRVTSIDGRVTSIENDIEGLANGTSGIVQQDVDTRVISVGRDRDGTVVDVAGTQGARVLTGIADGSLVEGSREAVSGSQLAQTNTRVQGLEDRAADGDVALTQVAGALGGGAAYDRDTREFTGPSYALSSGTQTNVGAALAAVDNDIVSLRSVAVQYDNVDRTSVTLNAGGQAVAVNNVRDGSVAAGSQQAVNGGQLFATNQAVAENTVQIAGVDGRVNEVDARVTQVDNRVAMVDERVNQVDARVTQVDDRVSNVDARVTLVDNRVSNVDARVTQTNVEMASLSSDVANGRIGMVQQEGGMPGDGLITVGAGTGGSEVSFAGTSGARRLSGVTAGRITADSVDAINGGQLFALQQDMAAGVSVLDSRVGSIERSLSGMQFDLRRLNRDLNRGLASVTAMTSMPMAVNAGKFVFGSGVGYRDGEIAGSFGLSYRTTDDVATINLRAGFGSDHLTAGAGLGVEF